MTVQLYLMCAANCVAVPPTRLVTYEQDDLLNLSIGRGAGEPNIMWLLIFPSHRLRGGGVN